MRKRRIVMLIAALLANVIVFGETFTDGNGLRWEYSVDKTSGDATLSAVKRTDGQDLTGVLVIPSTVTSDLTGASATVVEIKAKSFQGLAITGLNLPNTLTTINSGAFSDCTSLTSLSFPDSLKTVSGNTSSGGRGAFSGCTSLTSVNLGNGIEVISDGIATRTATNPDPHAASGVFGNCINLETVTFGTNLLEIGHHAFSECHALASVTFPNSLRRIGANAFCRNAFLSAASFGTDLTEIGAYAFYDCPALQSVVFRPCDTPILSIGGYAFAKATKLTVLTFSESLTAIGAGAFSDCTSLISLSFPDSLKTVSGNTSSGGRGAFSGCTSLTSVNLGNGLETISDGIATQSAMDPDSHAASGVFGSCSSLSEVTFGPRLDKIGRHAFSECHALESVAFPDSLRTIEINAFCRNTSLASVLFGTGLEKVGACAFYDCPELQSIVFRPCDTPILSIGDYAFAKATKLTVLTFSESLTAIGAGAFSDCTSLISLSFPDSLKTVSGNTSSGGRGAFSGCTSLTSVNLGNGLETISDGIATQSAMDPDSHAASGVFGNCSSLSEVTFGPRLDKIGRHAFSECRALKSLAFPDSLQTIGLNCFYNNRRLAKVAFGANLWYIGSCAFMNCESLSSVSFSSGTTSRLEIHSKAFKSCTCLTSLLLPNALPTLETDVFSGCKLLRVTIPSLVSTIDDNVFAGVSNTFKEVIFLGLPPENLGNIGLPQNVSLRYPKEYEDDWVNAIATCGFDNAKVYEPADLPGLVGDSGYDLSTEAKDRSIASIEVSKNMPLSDFIMKDGKVYDCIIRIVNTAAEDITVTLPAGYTYESFKSATPLTIPANSRNILTITRTSDSTFLVTREELAVLQQ